MSRFESFRRRLEAVPVNEPQREPGLEPLAEHVIHIILDGISFSFLEAVNPPNVGQVQKEGVSFTDCHTTFPSITGPAHTSLNTGAYPCTTGVVLPWRIDRATGELVPVNCHFENRAECLSEVLLNKGFATAGVCGHMMRGLHFFVSEAYLGHDATRVTDTGIKLLRQYRPHYLQVVYFATDTANHCFGVGSDESVQTLHWVDREIGRLLDELINLGLDDKTVIAINADHGHVNVQHEISRNIAKALTGLHLRAVPYGRIVCLHAACRFQEWEKAGPEVDGTNCAIPPAGGNEVIDNLIHRIRQTLAAVDGVEEIWSQTDLQKAGSAHASFGDAVILLREGYAANPGGGRTYKSDHGAHTPDEIVVPLILKGPGVRRGVRLDHCETVDVAPTLARILGVKPPQHSNGRVLTQVLA